jgi:hypothetical protein
MAHADPEAPTEAPTNPQTDTESAPAPPPPVRRTPVQWVDAMQSVRVTGGLSSSARGVAEDYLVLPQGAELTGDLKLITSGPSLGGQPLSLGDLALFELGGRYALARRVEISGTVDFLPKQPTYTDEKAWQSAGVGARFAITHNVALGIGGATGHLLDHDGEWLRQNAVLEWKHPLNEYVAFDLQGDADAIQLAAPSAQGAQLTELGIAASTFFSVERVWGTWIGAAYSVPIEHGGIDPTTAMAIDPKPRLDLHIGTVWAVVPEWDLFIDAAIITRGNMQNPATELPILDGGFDQRQVMIGVTRHFISHHQGDRRTVNEPLQM